jgi:hypothetical protein
MGNLTNKYVKDTYDGLLKLTDETQGVKATLQSIQDGLGNDLPIKVSSTEVVITGSFYGDGTNLTGITPTNAVSASHAIYAESALSASYADLSSTASYAENVNLPSDLISGSDQIVELGFATTSSLTSLSSSIASTDLDQDGRLNSLEGESGSIRNDFNTYTSSNDSKVNSLISGTGSYATTSSVTSLSSSIASTDLGQDNRLNSLETESGSIRGDFNSFTSSQSGVDSAQDGRLDSLESKTGSYATTGSNVFVGQQQINSDLIIQGNLYVSGSETIISSSTLVVGDREIELNANRTVGNAGIIVYDVVSPETTGSLQYDVTNNHWIIGQYGSEERVVDVSMTSSMSVLSSSYSVNSTSASHSETSDNAVSSSHSLYAESSLSSSHSIYSENSLSSSHSETSDNAVSASHSVQSDNAVSSSHSIYSESSLSSSHSETSDNAISSSHSIYAESSLSSSHSIYAESSLSSSHALYAENSLSSSHSIYSESSLSSSYADVAGSAGSSDSALRTTITAKNVSGFPMAKGTPCYITGSGTGGNLVGVFPADAGNPSRMPAGVVLNAALNDGDEGEAIVVGFINGVNTSAFGSGDSVYVAVGGGYTNVKPTGSALIQKLGNVEKSGVNGSGVITGPGRSNDVPNIQEGYIWVGNSDQVATPTSTGSFARRDEVNVFTQDQIITGSVNISGNTTLNGNQTVNGVVTQNITAPATDEFRNFIVTSGANVAGKSYNQVAFTLGDLPSFGTGYEDYFAIEYYDSFAYNFGSEVSLNGKRTQLTTLASGSGQQSYIRTVDNYDGTSQVSIGSPNKILLTGPTVLSGSLDVTGPIYADGGISTNGGSVLNIGSDNQVNILNFLTISSGSTVNGYFEIKDGVNITGSINHSGSMSSTDYVAAGLFIIDNPTESVITTTTGSLFFQSANANTVNFTGPVYAQTASLYAKDIIMDDPGATTSLVMNPDIFSVYKGNSMRWQEGDKSSNIIMFENQVYLTMNGWDPDPGYTYDSQFDIKVTSGSLEFSTSDLLVDFNPQTFLKVVGKGKPQLTNGVHITGSVAQQPHSISISSATASIDFSQSNVQTLTLASGTPTHIEATNMVAGQSVLVEITQDGSSAGTVTFDGSITFPGGTDYVPTTTLGGKDVLTLVSFDGSVSRAAGQNDFS